MSPMTTATTASVVDTTDTTMGGAFTDTETITGEDTATVAGSDNRAH